MLQNHRPYQLILSQTRSPLLAGIIAHAAHLYGVMQLSFQELRKPSAVLPTPETARVSLQALCPKPQPSSPVRPLPPQDDAVDLSIIIPSRNVEAYIDHCLQSILSQEGEYRIQIIVVDGNSQDRTVERVRAYLNDPRVTLIETTGPSSAARGRNEGLLHAVGKYLMFVDSDDQLAPGAIKALMDTARKADADVVQGGWQYIDENDVLGPQQLYAETTYTGKYSLDVFDLPGMPWGKVYRRTLFEKIRFPENYTCFEDAIIHFLVFRSAQKTVSIDKLVYFWRRNSKGLTASNQHRPTAVQSYWIIEELLAQDAALELPHDARFCASLVMQLSNYCYETVSKMATSIQKDIFALCCDLYANAIPTDTEPEGPYLVRCGAKALKEHHFELWCRQGQVARLL